MAFAVVRMTAGAGFLRSSAKRLIAARRRAETSEPGDTRSYGRQSHAGKSMISISGATKEKTCAQSASADPSRAT
jgi:hypothetical protein